MKTIQEVKRLRNNLNNTITRLNSDSSFVTNVVGAQETIKALRFRLQIVDYLIDHYVIVQWLFDNNIKDADVLNVDTIVNVIQ